MFREIKEDTNMLLGEFQENANKKLKEMKALTSYMREEFNRDRNTKEENKDPEMLGKKISTTNETLHGKLYE